MPTHSIFGQIPIYIYLLLSLTLALIPGPLVLAEEVPVPRPQLDVKYDKDSKTLVVNNHEPGPYTFTFRFPRFENTQIDCDNPCTRVVYPGRHAVIHYQKSTPRSPGTTAIAIIIAGEITAQKSP